MKIVLENINKTFGEKSLFSNFNLTIEDNTIVGIFGESGAGKTTLLNMIGIIEPIDDGIIYFDDQRINYKKDQRKLLKNNISFIFQNFGLLENESVRNNLMMLSKFDRVKKDVAEVRIKSVLGTLGLHYQLDQKVFTLSGGEQQRIAIAKVILKDSSLILADEPTASLDDKNKQFIMEQLVKLKEMGKTIVIVSHDTQIKQICDQVIIIGKN